MRSKRSTKILMIYTGGTIGMKENPSTHALEPLDFSHLLDNVPKLKMLDYKIDSLQFSEPLDSSAMTPCHWKEIAEAIEKHYEDYDGFVILHGTDTMAYTASALSFMLKNLRKPVIITGSQLPIGEVRTDGEENLITALQVAAECDSEGKPMVKEVAILFENSLLRGNRSTKHSADKFNAFQSNNYPRLAKIGLGITYNHDALLHEKCGCDAKLEVEYGFDSNVMVIDLFPGLHENLFRYMLNAPGIRGIVMKTFGAGNGPSADWFLKELKEAVDRGVVIVNVTQCGNGCVLPYRYETGRKLREAGVISGHDLTAEAAITKLMHLLAQSDNPAEVKRLMEENICGEMTDL